MDAINANRASAAPAGGAGHAAVATAAAHPAAGSPGKTARAGMPAAAPASRPPRTWTAARLLPLIGPLALYVVWDLVVRLQLVSPVLLPTPDATLVALAKGMAGGPLLGDFLASVSRTLQAFVIAGVIGVPLGVLLGSNEKPTAASNSWWTSSARRRRRR